MYKIIDLFAGAGGLSLGFEMTNQFEVVAIIENNKNAARTYINNHPGLKNYGDILTVDFKKLLEEQGMADVIIGGPPCQGFSNANRQRRKLINGSNELVKKYVQAIKELKPKAFVMENVKTIASNKHSFCLTYEDEYHICKELELETHNKDVVIYEGEYVNDLIEIIRHKQSSNMILVDEDKLYTLQNIYKKRDKVDNYLLNSKNIKNVNEILESLKEKEDLPRWYNKIIKEASEALKDLIKTRSCTNSDIIRIERFWNVQRLFHGVLEMDGIGAIYDVIGSNQQIQIRMRTYIVIDFIKKSFSYLKYKTKGEVLNSASFGVPQCRERYILIGMKEDLLGDRELELPAPLINDFQKYITVRSAISDLEKYAPTIENMSEIISKDHTHGVNNFYRKIVFDSESKIIYNHVCTNTKEIALKRFEVIKQGDNFHSLPDEYKSTYENPGRTQNTIYKRLSYDQPSDTVVNVRKSMWIHPVLNRAISAREAARLQGFPDKYKFIGTKDSVYQQIGNAVPPLLGRAVAEVILELLRCKNKYEKLSDIYKKYR